MNARMLIKAYLCADQCMHVESPLLYACIFLARRVPMYRKEKQEIIPSVALLPHAC